MNGLIHIYTGDGKGKTSAATGLAVRFAGKGGRVLFAQFLKDGSSGEISVLKDIDGIEADICSRQLGFSFNMNAEEKQQAKEIYSGYLNHLIERVENEDFGLVVFDEIIAAYNNEFIDKKLLLEFLRSKPQKTEVVLTGRNPAEEITELADYVSEIKKIKHPYDKGIYAREGIEY